MRILKKFCISFFQTNKETTSKNKMSPNISGVAGRYYVKVEKFLAFYGTRRFILVFTKAHRRNIQGQILQK